MLKANNIPMTYRELLSLGFLNDGELGNDRSDSRRGIALFSLLESMESLPSFILSQKDKLFELGKCRKFLVVRCLR